MALINCSECNHQVSDKASSCPNCGAPITHTYKEPEGTLHKMMGGFGTWAGHHPFRALLLLLFLLGTCTFMINKPSTSTHTNPADQTQSVPDTSNPGQSGTGTSTNNPSVSQTQPTTSTAEDEIDPFDKMTSTEHLAEAKSALKIDLWSDVKRHAEAIKEQDKEYREAKKLLKKVEQLEKHGEIEQAKASPLQTEKIAAAQKVMSNAKYFCQMHEEGPHLVVEMWIYLNDPNQRLSFVRNIANADAALQGRSRNIYFYDPSHKKIAQADTLMGVRLVD